MSSIFPRVPHTVQAFSIDFKGELGQLVRAGVRFCCEYTDAHTPWTNGNGYWAPNTSFTLQPAHLWYISIFGQFIKRLNHARCACCMLEMAVDHYVASRLELGQPVGACLSVSSMITQTCTVKPHQWLRTTNAVNSVWLRCKSKMFPYNINCTFIAHARCVVIVVHTWE